MCVFYLPIGCPNDMISNEDQQGEPLEIQGLSLGNGNLNIWRTIIITLHIMVIIVLGMLPRICTVYTRV